MSSSKRATVSLRNTPVRRALANANHKFLIGLLIVGFAAGFFYKGWLPQARETPPAMTATEAPR